MLITQLLVLGNSVTGYCRFTFLLCKKRFATHYTVTGSSTQTCMQLGVCVGKFAVTGSFLLICELLKEVGAWLYRKNGEMSPPSNVTHCFNYTFLFILTERFVSYSPTNLIAHLSGKWKWKTYSIISSLCSAECSHAYLCMDGYVRKLASRI